MENKDSLRQKVWSHLEATNIANFPRPVYHRIPNFKGADIACDKLKMLDEFTSANVIKINPDKPQQQARFLTLERRKKLLVPTPRIKSGLLNEVLPLNRNKKHLRLCASSEGVRNYSLPISLDDSSVKIDLVIVGSVAVDKAGRRIGKGEGYADLEFAILSSIKAIDTRRTIVITIIHDCQLFDELPSDLFGDHDLTADIIITTSQIIRCEPRLPKPTGIIWSLLTEERVDQIPTLKLLRERERAQGKNVELEK